MNKHQSGVKVARGLRSSEHALDDAIASTMRLGADMVEGRKAAQFAASIGQKALTDVMAGLGAMVAARDALISAHRELLLVADEHDIVWRMDGAAESKPVGVVRTLHQPTANAA